MARRPLGALLVTTHPLASRPRRHHDAPIEALVQRLGGDGDASYADGMQLVDCGTYYLRGEAGVEERPVPYADSEGQATWIGADLVEAITLIVVLPFWRWTASPRSWPPRKPSMNR
ncbi:MULTISPECIES: hypothetical protein [Streptomyces]|uniref:hypothetical protein n=1 Tax=Streptomyces TaxID=1883 RepID=UPI00143041D3|nr:MULTISPECIES: hypothetical protein [Streptomyces]MCH0555974.1 hypothetical protein [Streptomyces sp. MUM 16J]